MVSRQLGFNKMSKTRKKSQISNEKDEITSVSCSFTQKVLHEFESFYLQLFWVKIAKCAFWTCRSKWQLFEFWIADYPFLDHPILLQSSSTVLQKVFRTCKVSSYFNCSKEYQLADKSDIQNLRKTLTNKKHELDESKSLSNCNNSWFCLLCAKICRVGADSHHCMQAAE